MKAIVAVAPDWGIGRQGQLLVRIPEDLKRFRALTLHQTVVMGHTTFASLPGGKGLPHRRNLVLSRQAGLMLSGAEVVPSLEALFSLLHGAEGEVYVIGGEQVYRLLLPYCDTALVTHFWPATGAADCFFPNLLDGALAAQAGWQWQPVEETPPHRFEDLTFRYVTYQNTRVRAMAP